MTVIALLGAKALVLTFIWLASGILASYLSERKGYGDKAGLATGLILTLPGAIVWILIPARSESDWKRFGPVGTRRKSTA